MKFEISKKILISVFGVIMIFPIFILAAEEDLEKLCGSIENIEKNCEGLSSSECRNFLERCLKYLEGKSNEISQDISKTEKQKKTLQGEISLLAKKINQLANQIQQSNVMIRDLTLQIRDTESSIEKTSQKVEEKKRQLKEILRVIYEMDRKSLFEILLTDRTLSNFFDQLIYLETLNSKSQEILEIVKNLKKSLEEQRMILDTERENLQNVLKMQILQKQESEKTKQEKDYLAKMTESQYQKLLAEKKEIEKKAAAIRAKIFELVGVEKAPSFGEAIEIAKAVTNIINIRPAFLLAIISQESAIGRNVGQCYLTNTITGEGVRIATGEHEIRVMNPQRDIPIFLELTKKLNLNHSQTPVSCWIPIYISGKPFGWGGAMGPAQFIPSTWNLYEERISQLLAGRVPNPWAIFDSFLAAAIYLADLGATAKTPNAERVAANKYCGGYSWYATRVMERADCIQTFIDTNTMDTYCQDLIGLR